MASSEEWDALRRIKRECTENTFAALWDYGAGSQTTKDSYAALSELRDRTSWENDLLINLKTLL